MDDLIFLGLGGFLLGSLFYTGYYTTQYEPKVKWGYFVVGLGVAVSVAVNVVVEFIRSVSDWFRIGTVLGYALVAIGLMMIIRTRRRMHKG